jgi:hypothetical protein
MKELDLRGSRWTNQLLPIPYDFGLKESLRRYDDPFKTELKK